MSQHIAISMADFKELQTQVIRLAPGSERERLLKLLAKYRPPVQGDPHLTLFMFEGAQYAIPTLEGRRVCAEELGLILLPNSRLVEAEVYLAPLAPSVFRIVSVKLYTGGEEQETPDSNKWVQADLHPERIGH